MRYEGDTNIGGTSRNFPATRRSLIAAGSRADELGREALSKIIALYWKPTYKYIRARWRRSNEDAKDLVQAFFTELLQQETLSNFDPGKARFRTYFRGAVDNFVMKHDEFTVRLKRGGGQVYAFDFDSAEFEFSALNMAENESPEELFLREWRREIFALALKDLEAFCHETGREVQYRVFEAYDLADERPSYVEVAAQHGVSVATVTNYLRAMRRELRRIAVTHVERSSPRGTASTSDVRQLFDD
jgi:RNA polymerase sigma factor (sigma-70 family)